MSSGVAVASSGAESSDGSRRVAARVSSRSSSALTSSRQAASPTEIAQRPAPPVGFDLDRAQPLEHASGDDLAARAVGAGQHDQQLAVARACPTRSNRRSSRRSAWAR